MIRIPEDTLTGYRLAGGQTVVTRAVITKYGIEYLRYIFPDSTIHAVEDLLPLMDEDGQDRPETPGGQP